MDLVPENVMVGVRVGKRVAVLVPVREIDFVSDSVGEGVAVPVEVRVLVWERP